MIIAIVGATGLVGRHMLKILDEFGYLTNNTILLYASAKSAGSTITQGGHTFIVNELSFNTINKQTNFALFSAGSQVSKLWAKVFAKHGTIVIDNSNAFRRFKNVPLVVPEINIDNITKKDKIIANPNCSTIGLCVAINKLHQQLKINRIVVSTYQAVSGGGQKALLDLKNGTNNKFVYPILNNILPHIDQFLQNNYTKEEDKLMFETSKILSCNIPLCATAVRVPVSNCHSESLNIEFNQPVSINKIKKILNKTQGVTLLDDPSNNLYPMPIVADGTNQVFVGRIRKDPTNPNCINMFICFDNIRKGASLNAVQIMMAYIQKFFMNN